MILLLLSQPNIFLLLILSVTASFFLLEEFLVRNLMSNPKSFPDLIYRIFLKCYQDWFAFCPVLSLYNNIIMCIYLLWFLVWMSAFSKIFCINIVSGSLRYSKPYSCSFSESVSVLCMILRYELRSVFVSFSCLSCHPFFVLSSLLSLSLPPPSIHTVHSIVSIICLKFYRWRVLTKCTANLI